MCGITGVADFSGPPAQYDVVERMMRTLCHRGPDDSGVSVSGAVGLGHARLSVIDLSSAGHQPMRAADGRVALIFNGEAYNFKALRAKLEADGVAFHGHSDSEVVLQAYVRWGRESFKLLEGMFALALWDARSGELHLVRDRFGIKPLYYHLLDDGVVFGSEIKALLASDRVPKRLGLQGLQEYLWYGNALGENTLFGGVRKLLPGHCLTLARGRRELYAYWRIEDVAPIAPTAEEAAGEVLRRLENAVKSHLVSDVPVGIFLSGGIDSSAITALAARHYEGRLNTYAVGFDFDRGINELPKARSVAEHFGTEHHEIRIAGADMRDVIERLVHSHDEPFADAANIPLYLLCQQLKGSVKVVLQGDGGDEMFAGYRRYQVLNNERFWRIASRVALAASAVLPKNARYYRNLRFFTAMAAPDPAMRMALLMTVETPGASPDRILTPELRGSIADCDPFKRYRDLHDRFASLDVVQRMLYIDASVVLPDAFLEKVDKATMAHGIEVRVPFLDSELATYAMSLPSKLKVRRFQKKWILRKALRGIVPDPILDGPKTGFGVPYEYWLGGPLADYMKAVLFDSSIVSAGIFDRQELERRVAQHISGARDHGFLLWKALQLALWYGQVYRPGSQS